MTGDPDAALIDDPVRRIRAALAAVTARLEVISPPSGIAQPLTNTDAASVVLDVITEAGGPALIALGAVDLAALLVAEVACHERTTPQAVMQRYAAEVHALTETQ